MTKEQWDVINEMNDRMKKLRSGEVVICDACGEGVLNRQAMPKVRIVLYAKAVV